jgi:hypothetical protein
MWPGHRNSLQQSSKLEAAVDVNSKIHVYHFKSTIIYIFYAVLTAELYRLYGLSPVNLVFRETWLLTTLHEIASETQTLPLASLEMELSVL